MSDKHYTGEIGTVILVDCGSNISGASVLQLKVKKPDGTTATWAGTLEGTQKIRYTTTTALTAGRYYVQSYVEISGWKGHGRTTSFLVADLFDAA